MKKETTIVLNLDNKVTKSNKLIEAKYRLTLNEVRLILAYISLISPVDNGFPVARIKVKDLKGILELNGESMYEALSRTLEKLRSRVIKIQKLEENGFIITGWIDRAEYNGRKGELEIVLSKDLEPYLLHLRKNFTTYQLRYVLRLRSVYAIRIYELLKQYEKVGKRVFKIDELKELLGAEDKYRLYGHFKNKVLLKAQRELEEKTDISFSFREIKQGKKVVAVELIIKKQGRKEPKKLPKGKPFEKLPDKIKEVILEYLRTKDNIKSPIAVAKSMNEFEIEDTAYEILRHMIYFPDGQVKDPELEEEIYKLREENPQMKWTELLEVALEKRGV
ncbi:replication initiation protein [Hydrogenivirga sp. 128-5-R1-1]|uniref:replication initiation protein n=1 Tax=Hydrogenivirga sp. 128-5-R1-1 TaxID=392423 RepID=UPI00015F33CD|nr:replication initiation protein [Hydrogenivirga sp. 128-5-R1-1]EDP74803.1 replication initiator protein [Hydrogenivirga sp. 128-5-R1-1]